MGLHWRTFETVRETVLYCIANSLIDYSTMRAMAELTAQTHSHLGIGMRKKTERTKGRGG